jgi:segregation and condensation protein B
LDYFNLKNLEDLPSLAEIRDLDSMNQELALEGADTVVPELTEEAADEENSAEAVAGENDADGDNITSVDAADHTLVSAAVLPSAASDVVAESLAADIDTNALSAEDTEDVNSGNTSSDTASNTTNPNDIPA